MIFNFFLRSVILYMDEIHGSLQHSTLHMRENSARQIFPYRDKLFYCTTVVVICFNQSVTRHLVEYIFNFYSVRLLTNNQIYL